ncbi:MAG: penicillin-binding protein activator [Alphaproteobacteria bacterium]
MIKKSLILFLSLCLFGCSTQIESMGGFIGNNKDIGIYVPDAFNVAVLLPTSGAYAKTGTGMRNATQMALEDTNNPNLILRFYDTKSNPTDARIALENALSNNPDLIIGPLLSANLKSISPKLGWKNIPIISFATNPDALSKDVYSIGLLSENQIDRMFEYTSNLGKQKFALLLPENNTGQSISKSAEKIASNYNVDIISTTFYPPQTTDFSSVLKNMTNYDERKKLMNAYKAGLEAKALEGDEQAQRELKTLGENDAMVGVDFDAVLIADGGARLKSALSMFGYYDVSYPEVLFFGTSVWEGTELNDEENAIGSLYPALSRQYSSYFNNKYESLFQEKPSTLYALAYDATALASTLSKAPNLKDAILKKDGYAGLNGVFRFLENGQSEHVLDIYQVRKDGDTIINVAPKKFK